jgi:DNA-binding NtrC family response regulator
MKSRLLIVDDDEVSGELFAETLEGEGYDVEKVTSGDQALARLGERAYDLLIVDVRMPGMSGLDVTRAVHEGHPLLPVIVMTAFGSIETAIEAIHEGAFDFISKPMNLGELKKAVEKALVQRTLQRRAHRMAEGIEETTHRPMNKIIGKTPAMLEVYKTVARVAPTKSTVLILGESGTGKEMIARAIHEHSPRATRPFVAVDCGALTESLLESELFGHMRGSFTGAVSDKKGVFEESHGGTCFLDEVGGISASLQARLLRVLQEHEVRRVGGRDWIGVDVRVVAATNYNLAEAVKQGMFRRDLFYRLNVVTIQLPPLRERPEDIPLLADHFLKHYCAENNKDVATISDRAMELLCAYTWPGNIRELENAIEQAVALSFQPVLTPEDLPREVREPKTQMATAENGAFTIVETPSLEEVKKRYILHLLRHTAGNVSATARILNIDRRSLYRMLTRYKIQAPLKDD